MRKTGVFALCFLILIQAVCCAARGAEDVVELKAVRARLSNLYFHVDLANDAVTVSEVRVFWVAPDSGADRAGIRVGDLLTSINGTAVAGMRKDDLVSEPGSIRIRGTEVTFAGKRGILRRPWSLTATIDAKGQLEPIGR